MVAKADDAYPLRPRERIWSLLAAIAVAAAAVTIVVVRTEAVGQTAASPDPPSADDRPMPGGLYSNAVPVARVLNDSIERIPSLARMDAEFRKAGVRVVYFWSWAIPAQAAAGLVDTVRDRSGGTWYRVALNPGALEPRLSELGPIFAHEAQHVREQAFNLSVTRLAGRQLSCTKEAEAAGALAEQELKWRARRPDQATRRER